MDHVVYIDAKANELESLFNRTKTMIIRGAMGRKLPYGRVSQGDVLYFINNNADGKIRAKAVVSSVYNSEKMTEKESIDLIMTNQNALKLTESQLKRWSGKKYIVLVSIIDVCMVDPFAIDKSNYGNMDDWLPVEKIENVKIIEL